MHTLPLPVARSVKLGFKLHAAAKRWFLFVKMLLDISISSLSRLLMLESGHLTRVLGGHVLMVSPDGGVNDLLTQAATLFG